VNFVYDQNLKNLEKIENLEEREIRNKYLLDPRRPGLDSRLEFLLEFRLTLAALGVEHNKTSFLCVI
jgi:hypothetical protein